MRVSSFQAQQVRAIRAAGKDYYKILGVSKNCDDAQLKKAYRKVSLSLHLLAAFRRACTILCCNACSMLCYTECPPSRVSRSNESPFGCAAGGEVASGQMVRAVTLIVSAVVPPWHNSIRFNHNVGNVIAAVTDVAVTDPSFVLVTLSACPRFCCESSSAPGADEAFKGAQPPVPS